MKRTTKTESEFKVGDIVVLKSGGPKMTVSEVNDIPVAFIRTTWFAGSKNEKGNFPPEALMFPPEPDQKTK
jgi:uncharacterized protein YodC (DUF2158 family)